MKQRIIAYDRLLRERYRYVTEIQELLRKSVIRASIRIQGNRCGTKGCRCKREHNPILHGPYPYLSYRGKAKNHSILLTKKKDIHAIRAIDNYKKLIATVIKLSDADFTILRYYSHKLMEDL
ncbi:MAG: DUF6788 family protein [Candidatus Omnitrophota bacterium]